MEKITKLVVLSVGFFLYFAQGQAIALTTQFLNPSKNFEVKQAQASVVETHSISHENHSDSSKKQDGAVSLGDKQRKLASKSQLLVDAELKKDMLDSIRIKLWSGNYRMGEEGLAAYKEKFGSDENYLMEKARLLALTNQSKTALIVLEPLLKKYPTNGMLLDIKKYALQHPEVSPIEATNGKSVAQKKIGNKTTDLSTVETVIDFNDPLLQLADEQSKKAEFKKSAKTYHQYLQSHPKEKAILLKYIRVELWAANFSAAEKALLSYEKKFGSDEDSLTEKARLFALTNKSSEALRLINALLKKYPNNQFLPDIKAYALKHPNISGQKSSAKITAKTVISNPPRSPEAALDSYRKILILKPHDRDAMLGVAQSYSQQNRLADAADAYVDYLQRYPDDKSAWIAYTYIKDWSGDSVAALKVLQTYSQLFGKTSEYLETKARVLAEAERPTPSLRIVTPLLRQKPNDVELNHTRVVALYYNNQPVEMFENLKKLKSLTSNNAETKDLSDFLKTPYRSNVNLDLLYSKDVDTVEIDHAILTGQIFITPLTKFLLVAREESLSARIGSNLEPIEGGNGLTISEETIGINRQFTPHVNLEAALGNAHVTYGQNAFVYHVAASLKPVDALLVNLLESRNYYDVSARAVSLGIIQQLNQISVNWEPCLQRYLFLQSSYSTFSDTNTMWSTNFSPKIGLWRGEMLNFDLGMNGQWFGFSKRLNNGYYNSKLYQYYSITGNGYIKQSMNVAYGFSFGLGQQKDETFTSYKFGGDASVVGYFGIYKDWMLVVSAGISNRGRSNIGNNFNVNSNYRIWAFDAAITRRF